MKNEKGITLIALVITIIVMLILVAVTIRVATDGNLFTHAANAVTETKTKAAQENALSEGNLGDKSIEEIVAAQTGDSSSGAIIQEIHNWQRGTGVNSDQFTCTCTECKKVNTEGRTLTIGQQLAYQDNGTGTSSISAEKSGHTESQTIAKDTTTTWVVLGAEDRNNNGTNETLLLTTENPTTDTITLVGAAGYNFWVEESNRIAKELYGNRARGITADDVDSCLQYTPDITPHTLSTDDNYNSIIENGNGTVTPDPTDNDTAEDLGNYIVDGHSIKFDSLGTPAVRSVLIPSDDSTYWLSTVSVKADASYAHFGPGAIYITGTGKKCFNTCVYLFANGNPGSPGNPTCSSKTYGFRAVVSLDSDVPTS